MGLTGVSTGLGLGGDIMGGIKGQNALNADNAGLNSAVNNENNAGGMLQTLVKSFQNYQPLTQAQTNEITGSMTQGGQSAVNTFKSQQGGVANPALLIQKLMTQNQQAGSSLGLGIANEVAGQKLGALQGAAGAAEGAGSIYANEAQQYGSAAASQGNPWGQAFSNAGTGLASAQSMKS